MKNSQKNHEDANQQENENISVSSHRLEQLYSEAQAVKMLNLKQVVQAGKEWVAEASAEYIKHSQMVLKSIEIQLRILGEGRRHDQDGGFPRELEVIWEAMVKVPQLRALLSRKPIRDAVISGLKGRDEKRPGPSPANDREE